MSRLHVFALMRIFKETVVKSLEVTETRTYDMNEVLVLSRVFSLINSNSGVVLPKFKEFEIAHYDPTLFNFEDSNGLFHSDLYQVRFSLETEKEAKKYMYVLLNKRDGEIPKVAAVSYISDTARPDMETLTSSRFWMVCNIGPIPLS